MNFSGRGVRTTVGIPGTGISYTTTSKTSASQQSADAGDGISYTTTSKTSASPQGAGAGGGVVAVLIMLAIIAIAAATR